jgi:hypothetical protein
MRLKVGTITEKAQIKTVSTRTRVQSDAYVLADVQTEVFCDLSLRLLYIAKV